MRSVHEDEGPAREDGPSRFDEAVTMDRGMDWFRGSSEDPDSAPCHLLKTPPVAGPRGLAARAARRIDRGSV
jgi:hypothetical protein